jgi:hypothetical protein
VNRYFLILSAVALGAGQPNLALAAPPSAPAYHPAYRSGAAPMPRARSDSQAPFKMPFEANLHPRSPQFDPQAAWSPLRWHGWHPVPAALFYQPMWYQIGCYPSNSALVSWNSPSASAGTYAPPTEFTVGSLVDGHGNIFGSSPADVAKVTSSGSSATSPSNLVTLTSTACGAVNSFSL